MRFMCLDLRFWSCILGGSLILTARVQGDEVSVLNEQLRQVQQQNEQLRQQLGKMQQLIESLSQKVSNLEQADNKRAGEYQTLKDEVAGQTVAAPAESKKLFSFGKVVLGGEGGVAFLESGNEGMYPNAEFRVYESKLFLEAPVWKEVYFFGELDLTIPEAYNNNFQLGELYLDWENISRLWGQDRMLNLRVGRMDIPFGEEYLLRDTIDNPLILHSLGDLWGVDEGVELYGKIGKVDYAVAVQNGGNPQFHDYNPDKSVSGRLGYEPAKWLRVSGSAMRTGQLSSADDKLSAMWFGNGYFRTLGASATTTKFHADLYEGDVQLRFPKGHLYAAGGYVDYNDNNTAANDQRDVYYYYVEGLYNITEKFYGAARFSQILAQKGFPIVGDGDFKDYFYGTPTKDLWRLTIGGGYRWSRDLVLKAEYTFERGEEIDGGERDHEDLFGVELAYRF